MFQLFVSPRKSLVPFSIALLVFTTACGQSDRMSTDANNSTGDYTDVEDNGRDVDIPDQELDVENNNDGVPPDPDTPDDESPDTDPDIDDENEETPEPLPPEPPIVLLTVNEVPAYMNGSLYYWQDDGVEQAFQLHVNRENFTLDVMLEKDSGPVDWDTLNVHCDVDLFTQTDSDVLAGDTISPELFIGTDRHRRLLVDADSAFPEQSDIHCMALIDGPAGSSESSIVFTARDLHAELDPFVEPDTWLVVLSRDIFETTLVHEPNGESRLVSKYNPQGSGVADLDELFYAIGLFSVDAPEVSDWVKDWLLGIVRREVWQMFGLDDEGKMTSESVPIRIYFEGDDGAPARADFQAGNFSMIALGGDYRTIDGPALGRAYIDWNNQHHENNTIYGLGVFTTNMLRMLVESPLGPFMLRQFYPGIGHPLGTYPGEENLHQPGFNPQQVGGEVLQRFRVVEMAIENGGLAIAAVLAHEIGHSLGLVPPGAPPYGLFSGMPGLNFTPTYIDDAHIDTPGMNIMQSGASFDMSQAFNSQPHFNALNMAYLKRRLVVGAP